MMDMEKEFILYLKQNPALHRFMELWKEKYKCLGKLGGSITLVNPTSKEKEAISRLLGMYFNSETDISIRYTQVAKALSSTKYEGMDFSKVLQLYFNDTLESNFDKRERKKLEKENIFQQLLQEYNQTKAQEWLLFCKNYNTPLLSRILQQYSEDATTMDPVLVALNHLPMWEGTLENIAIFSTEITKNPHFFDQGKTNNLLLQGICYFLNIDKIPVSLIDRNKIWLKAGLVKEELLNYCTICHINAMNSDEQEHIGLQYFFDSYEPMHLHIVNMQNIIRFHGVSKIIIIENPSVFRHLTTVAKQNQIHNIGFVCTYGELNFCSYLVLDCLLESSIPMYYCGDFDPEGILIADKLKQRYQGAMTLWHYHKEDYQISISQKKIESFRLQKLKNCKSSELLEIKTALLEQGKSGYQEALLQVYENELLQNINSN